MIGFEPENTLEHAMLIAAGNAAARPEFYRLLLESELVAMGELSGTGLRIETVENNGKRYHPVFTSERRVSAFSVDPLPHFRMQGRALFESTRGAAFVINPGSGLAKTLTPEEIALCLEKPNAPKGIVVTKPKAHPKRLIKGLCVLFTSRSLVKAAHLVHVRREGARDEPHPMIGLVADADVPRLASEIFEVAAEALPGTIVDVVRIDPERPIDSLHKQLLGVAPFYRRTQTLNKEPNPCLRYSLPTSFPPPPSPSSRCAASKPM